MTENSKPTTITAAEFVERQTYWKGVIRHKKADIKFGKNPIVDVCQRIDDRVNVFYSWGNDEYTVEQSSCELVITWLPQADTAQPVTEAGDDPLVVEYGDGYAAGYADGCKQYDVMQAELVALRESPVTGAGEAIKTGNDAVAEYILAQSVIESKMPMYKEYRESVDNAYAGSYSAWMGFTHWLATSLQWEQEKTAFLMKKRHEEALELEKVQAELVSLHEQVARLTEEKAGLREALEIAHNHLQAVADYKESPDIIGADDMDAGQVAAGMWSQAVAGLHSVDAAFAETEEKS